MSLKLIENGQRFCKTLNIKIDGVAAENVVLNFTGIDGLEIWYANLYRKDDLTNQLTGVIAGNDVVLGNIDPACYELKVCFEVVNKTLITCPLNFVGNLTYDNCGGVPAVYPIYHECCDCSPIQDCITPDTYENTNDNVNQHQIGVHTALDGTEEGVFESVVQIAQDPVTGAITIITEDGTSHVLTINEIDMDINQAVLNGAIITFTSEDNTQVTFDICDIVATNCNTVLTYDPNTGDLTFTDNAGGTTTVNVLPSIQEGSNIDITGSGSAADPYIINGCCLTYNPANGQLTISNEDGTTSNHQLIYEVISSDDTVGISTSAGVVDLSIEDTVCEVIGRNCPPIVTTDGNSNGVVQSGPANSIIDITLLSQDPDNNATLGGDGGIFVETKCTTFSDQAGNTLPGTYTAPVDAPSAPGSGDTHVENFDDALGYWTYDGTAWVLDWVTSTTGCCASPLPNGILFTYADGSTNTLTFTSSDNSITATPIPQPDGGWVIDITNPDAVVVVPPAGCVYADPDNPTAAEIEACIQSYVAANPNQPCPFLFPGGVITTETLPNGSIYTNADYFYQVSCADSNGDRNISLIEKPGCCSTLERVTSPHPTIAGVTCDEVELVVVQSDGSSETVTIPLARTIVDENGTTLTDSCVVALDRDLYIRTGGTEGSIVNSISTSFADAVPNGDGSLVGITTVDNQVIIAATNGSNTGDNSILSGIDNTSNGSHSFVTGNANILNNGNSIVTGSRNTINAGNSFVAGTDNTNDGPRSLVVGQNVFNSGANSIVSGNAGSVNSGTSSIIGGILVNNSGAESIVSGAFNTNTAGHAFVIGVSNNNNGSDAIIGGTGNNNDGPFNIVSGVTNNIDGASIGSLVVGTNNNLNTGGSWSTVSGAGNILTNQYNAVTGSNNSVNGRSNQVAGEGNTIDTLLNTVSGNDNQITIGQSNLLVGSGNSIGGVAAQGNSNIVGGDQNVVEQSNSLVIGGNNTTLASSGFSMTAGFGNTIAAQYSINAGLNNNNNINAFGSIVAGGNNVNDGLFSLVVGDGNTNTHVNVGMFGTGLTSTQDDTVYANAFIAGVTQLNVPDYVFEDDYELLTIEEHSDAMFATKHLPKVTSEKDLKDSKQYNVNDRVEQLLEELEIAHIYITQLNDRLVTLENK